MIKYKVRVRRIASDTVVTAPDGHDSFTSDMAQHCGGIITVEQKNNSWFRGAGYNWHISWFDFVSKEEY